MLAVECYDNKGATVDRYTALYQADNGSWIRLLMSDHPGTPQGMCVCDVFDEDEKPEVNGEPVKFWELPYRVRDAILHDILETSYLVRQASEG